MIEEEESSLRKRRSEEIHGLEQEKSVTLMTLEREKEKIAQIVDIINESGNYDLISKAEHIIKGEKGAHSA